MLSGRDADELTQRTQPCGGANAGAPAREQELMALELVATGLAAGDIALAVGHAADGREPSISYVNDAFLRMTGYRLTEIVGRSCQVLDGPNTSRQISLGLAQALQTNTSFDQELLHYRRDGTPFWNSVTVTSLGEAQSRRGNFLIIMRDVSERREADQRLAAHADRLYELAMSDPLTGIANRRSFDAAIERDWRRAMRQGGHTTLALLDIDHFKIYNDQLGHPAGDDCLRLVAALLGGALRHGTDILARYGGEEFAILLPNTDAQGAAKIARRLTDAVTEAAIAHPGSPSGLLSVSGGLLSVQPSQFAGGVKGFLVKTDHALYAAKSAGRGHIHCASA